jgi:5-methyltetrahydropteroyltriglutamate--homocysteine methyltransferase
MKAILPGTLLPTTVVGSYPVVQGSGLRSVLSPMRYAVQEAVSDQIAAGIDIISDGQVRGDMIRVFTSRLPGIREQRVIGKVMVPPAPVTLTDTRYALRKKPRVKGILTGPTTLAHGLRIDTPAYRNRGELAVDLAHALAPEAKALEEAGVTLIQLDEPIFSTGSADLQTGNEALALITARLRIPVCLHVCGDLSAVIDELLRMPVDVLDFEFAKSPENLDLLSRRDLAGRMIGFGCVDSSSAEIEPVATIQDRIMHGLEVLRPDQLLIDPDCGLRMHTRETAFRKLAHMVLATKAIRSAL